MKTTCKKNLGLEWFIMSVSIINSLKVCGYDIYWYTVNNNGFEAVRCLNQSNAIEQSHRFHVQDMKL